MENIDFRKYGLGALESKPDMFVYEYQEPAGATTNYPTTFSLHTWNVKNQGDVSSCVAHASATMREIQEYYETAREKLYSPGFIYGYRLSNHYKGEGMYLGEACETLVKVGSVELDDFAENFDYSRIQKMIADKQTELLAKAKNGKIRSYCKVSTVAQVKSALVNDKSPVLISVKIYDSWYENVPNNIYPTNVSGTYQGNHCMLIVGYTTINGKVYYKIQNSWGTEWRNGGFCFIPSDYKGIAEMFTTVDADNFTSTFSDVTGGKHWAEEAINACVKAGLINGYTDGTFKPNNTITRAEICSMLYKARFK